MDTMNFEKSKMRFAEIYRATCEIISTFRGRKGKQIVKKATSAIETSPELFQFVYELVFNAMVAERKTIGDEESANVNGEL